MARTRPTTGPVCPVCRWAGNTTAGIDAGPACARHGRDVIRCTDPAADAPHTPATGRRNRWTHAPTTPTR